MRNRLPSWASVGLAILSAILLVLAFPDFELWFLAYFALIPLFIAIYFEKDSFTGSFITGWVFGTAFFTGTCWWLTFAPINYGGVPAPIAYILLLGATTIVGIFPAIFAAIQSIILKRIGAWGILAAPFLWVAIEYLRFWLTGNNWNAIAYSQAFTQGVLPGSIGGIYLVGFLILILQTIWVFLAFRSVGRTLYAASFVLAAALFGGAFFPNWVESNPRDFSSSDVGPKVVALQPNVPMDGMEFYEMRIHRDNHVEMAERSLKEVDSNQPKVTIFPESPMNFMYDSDREFQEFIGNFARRNKTSVLFNSAEPTEDGKSYYNSAVMINEQGKEIAQYDKMYLVPFGEYVPLPDPIGQYVPSMVGRFTKGTEYDLLPFGDAKAGIMICFESHFPTLSREFAKNGADVIVEMTNDGYLGPTPVLRQHLANAVFRAVETGRPVLRVTNVGITAYIDEVGQVHEPSKPYSEDTRVWTVSKSNGGQTFYVKYGDWFAGVCVSISAVFLIFAFWRKKTENA